MATQSNFDSYESEPLLSSTSRNKKVWYRTASAYWLLPAFMVLSLTFGLGTAPRVQFYLRVVCYDYLKKEQSPSVTFSLNPINDDRLDELCNSNANVQAMTSQFLMILNSCAAIPAIFVLGPLGSLSDRKGRKISLLISTMGTVLTTLSVLLVGNFIETLGIYFLLIGSLIEGISGGVFSLVAISYSYATDCTSSTQRSMIFGWLQGSFFVGIALGPPIGGWMATTYKLFSVFYVMTGIYFVLFLFFLFILPESLTKENLLNNLKRHQELSLTSNPNQSLISRTIHNTFKPLTIFLQNNYGKMSNITTPYSLMLSAITSTLITAAMVGMQAIYFLYTTLAFKWSIEDQGYFLFAMGASRAFVLFILFPILVANFKKKIPSKNINNSNNEQIFVDEENISNDEKQLRQEFAFEVWVVRLGLLLDAFIYAACGLITSGLVFVGAIVTASLGSVATPTMKSIQTNLVDPSQTGQLLGALSVLESITRIISPIIFNTLYSIFVMTSPSLIWYGIAAILAMASLFSFCIVSNKRS